VIDTIKAVNAAGEVTGTVDREQLRRVQTPQGFRLSTLLAAHGAHPAGDLTDDAGLIERLGRPVQTVPGAESAFKITTPHDLKLAELLAGQCR
jgi:2-C-methyl-D-erythritol 4-phosphate cytidylyltransferase